MSAPHALGSAAYYREMIDKSHVVRELRAAGYRILAPGELDDASLEAAAKVATEAYANADEWDYFNSAEFAIATAIRNLKDRSAG